MTNVIVSIQQSLSQKLAFQKHLEDTHLLLIRRAELRDDLSYLKRGDLWSVVCHFGALITPLPPLIFKARIVIFRGRFKVDTGHGHHPLLLQSCCTS